MYCSNCGKKIMDNSVYCEHCGTKQNAQPPVQQEAQQPPMYQPIRVQPSKGKGWKIAFFCVFGATIIAFGLFAYVEWLAPKPDAATVWGSASSFADVLPGGSQFSLGDIGAQSEDSSTTDAGPVTQLEDIYDRVLGAWEGWQDGNYIGFHFFDDGTAQYIEDGDEEYYYYEVSADILVFTDENGESVTLGFTISDQNGSDCLMLQYDEYTYDLLRTDSISVQSPAEVPVQTPDQTQQTGAQDAKTVFANGFEIDIEAYIAETWWVSSGTWISNPDALPAAPGYPKVYNIGSDEIQYIFDSDALTVQMVTQDEDGVVTEHGIFDYKIDPYGFYLYAFGRTETIEGADYYIQSKFFVCDGVLFEVEIIDGIEVSNYIAYHIYGP